jgi:hypothetical protein
VRGEADFKSSISSKNTGSNESNSAKANVTSRRWNDKSERVTNNQQEKLTSPQIRVLLLKRLQPPFDVIGVAYAALGSPQLPSKLRYLSHRMT